MPLSGVRVVDLTRILAGPFCTQLLADLGAEVIKVEQPGRGDPVRGQGAIKDGLSWYYAQFNRNKKSIALDLYTDEGKAVLADLIRRADVLVENFRPGVLDEMGFTAGRLEALNPALIVGAVKGYGSTGPYVDRPAFDCIAQALSGFMSVSGKPESDPHRIRELLGAQIQSAVRWTDVMAHVPPGEVLETGPGGVLQGIARRIEGAPRVHLAGTFAQSQKWIGSRKADPA